VIPETLASWTLATLRELLVRGVFEDRRLEFKEMLPHGRDRSGQQRLRRTAAAFANTEGGFLVIGVRDDRALSANDRLVGCPAADEVPHDFGMLVSDCTPPVPWMMACVSSTISTEPMATPLRIAGWKLVMTSAAVTGVSSQK
jgi:hypothetical protein